MELLTEVFQDLAQSPSIPSSLLLDSFARIARSDTALSAAHTTRIKLLPALTIAAQAPPT